MPQRALIPIMIALLWPLSGLACDCVFGDLKEDVTKEWNDSAVVVVAKVIRISSHSEVHTIKGGSRDRQFPIEKQLATWRIVRSWKGLLAIGSAITTDTTTTCCLCGEEVVLGEVRLLYLGGKTPYAVSECSVGRRLEESKSQLPLLDSLRNSHNSTIQP